ncbi:MAG TPA: tetratricopeptide repeat protein [Candidatus Angelobacter sp.]|jgi:tetratricopeptide (TPR) repeat protein
MDNPLEEKAERAERSGDLQDAVELWKRLALHNQDAGFFCRYGNVAKELDRWDEAEAAFNQSLRLDPNLSAAKECMGALWLARTDKERHESLRIAKHWFVEALRHERNARVLTFLGNVDAALGDDSAARKSFEEAISLDPEYEEALFNFASLEAESDSAKASSLLQKALEIDPEYAAALRQIGVLFQKQSDPEEAEYHLRRALELDPKDYWAQMYLANLLGIQGRNEEAERIYRFATTLHPDIKEASRSSPAS